ncbi:MAG TPA: hypothetical protein VGR74_15420, partial [Actinomycetota bacterium]|nr:hypothetical protein [Actinomycetota bacterium]
VLAPLSVVAVWARGEVTDTDRYVDTVAPLAQDPAIQQAITTNLTNVVFQYIDVDGITTQTMTALAQRDIVPPALATQLQVLAKRFLDERGDVIDIPAWIAAADLTAARAAFVLSSDLPAAVRVLSAEPAGLTPVPLADRIKDLVAYSVSEEYFAVRQALGLQVV